MQRAYSLQFERVAVGASEIVGVTMYPGQFAVKVSPSGATICISGDTATVGSSVMIYHSARLNGAIDNTIPAATVFYLAALGANAVVDIQRYLSNPST